MPRKQSGHSKVEKLKDDPHLPIVRAHLRGTYDRPIVITSKSTISVNTFGIAPDEASNRIAYLRQENGFYPSVGQISDQAALTLSDCQFVVLKDLKFEDCWPAAVNLDNCQNIVILDCEFGPCTVAIGANGVDTRDIWIERCTFKQTPKRHLWDEIEWRQVHGSYENSTVGGVVDCDQRQFDGDFFRAWNIAGNVTIRDCDIEDAFNGIHFFNSVDDLPEDKDRSAVRFNNGRRSASNVLIENNRFARIRDNCIEPEDHAWNWVVRSNTFDDCYAPYSFELQRAGWFYIYDNHHWLENPARIGGRRGGSGFKLGGRQKNEGDFYIFNNSWFFRNGERLFRKRALGRMKHFNNALKLVKGRRRLFGTNWDEIGGLTDNPDEGEDNRFTRRWKSLEISMNGDWIHELDGLDWQDYVAAGYKLGDGTTNRNPGYSGPTKRPNGKKGERWLKPSAAMEKAGVAWTMRLPGFDEAGKGKDSYQFRYETTIDKGSGVGAGMSADRLEFFKEQLRFVPDFPVSRASLKAVKAS